MICANCRADNRDGAEVCSNCGLRLPAYSRQTYNAPASPQEKSPSQRPMQGTAEFAAQRPMQGTAEFTAQRPMQGTAEFAAQRPMQGTAEFAAQRPMQGTMRTGELPRINRPTRRKKNGLINSIKNNILKNKKRSAIVFAAVLVLLSFIVILLIPRSDARYMTSSTSIRAYYNKDTNTTHLSVNGKLAPFTLGGAVSRYSVSIDGSVMLAESDQGLFLVTAKKAKLIADKTEGALLSDNGNAVLYKDETGNLILYHSARSTKETVSYGSVFDYKFSPDGKTVIYAYEDGENDFVLSKYSSGRSVHVGDGVMPVSVSNNGRYVYAYNTGGMLYCYFDGQRVKISSDVMPYFFINTNGEELGFFTNTAKAYVSVRGGDKIKMFTSAGGENGYIYPVTDAHADAAYRTVSTGYTTCHKTGMDTFADSCISQAGSIYYIDKGYNGTVTLTAPSEIGRGALIYNGIIVYKNGDGDLCTVDHSGDGSEKTIAEGIKKYVVSSDGKYVYYINAEDELWVNNGKKSQKIADDTKMLYITSGSVALFITDYSDEYGGTLCYSDSGGSRHRIAEDVQYAEVGARSAVYYTVPNGDGEAEIYLSAGGKKFSPIFASSGKR